MLVTQGHPLAVRVAELLKRTDRLLGGILIGNTLVIVPASSLSSFIAIRLFGEDRIVYAIGTLVISFLIIIFSEITPKSSRTYPERTALLLSYPLKATLRLLRARGWFVNLFVRPLLVDAAHPAPTQRRGAQALSRGDPHAGCSSPPASCRKSTCRSCSTCSMSARSRCRTSCCPRARIEAIKLDDDMEAISHQVATSYHMRLPVFRDALGEVVGVLHLRKVLALLRTGELDKQRLERLLVEPYFVPSTTPVLAQLQYFQENKERIALVVDEYGELMGLITLEDIIEEIIGKFTTSLPSATPILAWDEQGTATAEGTMPVRDINQGAGLNLPTTDRRPSNGLIVEHLQDIPEADVSIKIGSVPMESCMPRAGRLKTVRISGRSSQSKTPSPQRLRAGISGLQNVSPGGIIASEAGRACHMATAAAAVKGPKELPSPGRPKDRGGKIIRGELRQRQRDRRNATLSDGRASWCRRSEAEDPQRAGSAKRTRAVHAAARDDDEAGVPLDCSRSTSRQGRLQSRRAEAAAGKSRPKSRPARRSPRRSASTRCTSMRFTATSWQAGEQAGILENLLERLASPTRKRSGHQVED